MLCERNPHPQALLQDSPHFAAHTLLPDHVSQLICSSFFQDQNPGGKKNIFPSPLNMCLLHVLQKSFPNPTGYEHGQYH